MDEPAHFGRYRSGDQLGRDPEILSRIFDFAPDAKLLVDGGGRIIEVNHQTVVMFGYDREELVGQGVEILIPNRFARKHVEYRSGYMAAPRMRPMGAGVELYGKRKDGTEFPVDIMLGTMDAGDERVAVAVVRDVTERKRVEDEASRAREMYLRELHHRVKNNLQVISSLLFLQSTYVTDPAAIELLKESRSRVKSIALIHEKLYKSPELTKIDFAEYLQDLVRELFQIYGVDRTRIGVVTDLVEARLEIDTAIPGGLIVNELVSNVLKHAFPENSPGEVRIGLSSTGPDEYILIVSDSGVGLDPGFDWRTSGSLGLKLVNDLARQLNGQVEVSSRPGTTFRITFKEIPYKERS